MILHRFGAALLVFGCIAQPTLMPKTRSKSPLPFAAQGRQKAGATTANGLAQQPAAEGNRPVSGTIVDAASGQPLAGALVSLAPTDDRDAGNSALTGDDGRFAFENVAPGHYVLAAGRKGYVQQLYKEHDQFSTAIVVGPDLVTDNLRFELRRDASISGQMVDERNEPVRNARAILFHQRVRFGRQDTFREREVGTDDRGRYRFSHLPPGVYFVAASAQPWYAQRVTHQMVKQIDSNGRTTYQEFTNGEPELDVVYPVTFFSHAEDIAGASYHTPCRRFRSSRFFASGGSGIACADPFGFFGK